MKVGSGRQLAVWAVLLVACLGCSTRTSHDRSSDADAGVGPCMPSATRRCVGPGACDGAQVCASDGTKWSVCDCGNSAGGSNSSGGTGSSGGSNAGGSAPQGGSGPEGGNSGSGGSGPQGGNSGSGGSGPEGGNGGSGPQGGAGSNGGTSSGGSGGSGAGCTTVELLSDPGFDLGLGSWSQHSDSPRSAIVNQSASPIAAHSPPNLAWLGGDNVVEDYILQNVTVTQPNATLKVSMYIFIETLEPDPVIFDRLVLDTQVEDEAIPRISLDNTDASDGYVYYEADVDPVLAGTQITFAVAMSNDASAPTAFYVDSLSFTATTCD